MYIYILRYSYVERYIRWYFYKHTHSRTNTRIEDMFDYKTGASRTYHRHSHNSCIQESGLQVHVIRSNVQRIAQIVQRRTVREAVVAEDALKTATTKSNHIIFKCDSQTRPVSVVVGEGRQFKNAFVEEATPVALGTVWRIDHGDTIVEHPRAVYSRRFRDQVGVLEVDAEHEWVLNC